VSVQARSLELHVREESSVPDNFRTAIDVLHICLQCGGAP
jgi:hypothetical protein